MGHKRIRVLQINKLYYPWVGGVEKVVQDISEGLKDKVNIEVLACQPKGLGRKKLINGVRERPIRGLISGHIYYISAGSLQVCVTAHRGATAGDNPSKPKSGGLF